MIGFSMGLVRGKFLGIVVEKRKHKSSWIKLRVKSSPIVLEEVEGCCRGQQAGYTLEEGWKEV